MPRKKKSAWFPFYPINPHRPMNRLFRCLLVALALLGFHFTASAKAKPNVLWIFLEDVSGWFGCYGDTFIKTPNIDALAKSGKKYDRFYTTAGVCSAMRSGIVTGMYQTSIGAHNHRSCRSNFRGKGMGKFDENILSIKTIPEIMRAAGYWTFNEGGKDDYNFTFDANKLYNYLPKKRGWGPADLVAGNCWKGKKKDQPFFGQVQLGGGKLGRRADKVVDRSKVPVPPYYPDTALVREEIGHHYDCLLKTDEQVGQVIAALKRDGHYENTLILLFSDHGYKLHRHKQYLYEGGIHMPLIVVGPGIKGGQVTQELVSSIDVSAATVAASGTPVPDYMEGQDFLSSDHTPRSYVISARDRCDYTIEHIRAVVTPQYKYLRNYLTDRPFMQPSYKDPWPVSKEFRRLMAEGKMNKTQLIFFGDKKEPEELYDLAKDPHEIKNLAKDPKYKKEIAKHRKILAQWIKETGDKGAKPESDIGLLSTLKRWGSKCVNPEYDKVRHLLKPAAPAEKPGPKKKK